MIHVPAPFPLCWETPLIYIPAEPQRRLPQPSSAFDNSHPLYTATALIKTLLPASENQEKLIETLEKSALGFVVISLITG